MKGTSNLIVTVILITFLVMFSRLPIHLALEQQNQFNIQRYNRIIKLSTKDAVNVLIRTNDDNSYLDVSRGRQDKQYLNKLTNLNLDKALKKFYESLQWNLNIQKDKLAKKALNTYVPLKLVVMYDGYYINTWQEKNKKLYEVWIDKKAFSYYDREKNLLINFTLTDDVMVFNNSNKSWETQNIKNLSKNLKKDYEIIKKKVIATSIRNDIKNCITRNNEIAKHLGINYIYNLPELDDNIFNLNAISDITFIAFVQGLPLKYEDVYNNYGYAATRMNYSKKYYSYNNLYHREDCTMINSKEKFLGDKCFDTQAEAAKQGFKPCRECILNQN